MRHIERLEEPAILTKKKNVWLADFLASGKLRPDSSKYANPKIRQQLASMSYHKCFYCEGMLKGTPKEVDHYVEVTVDKKKAFEWDNLYLACSNCNDKLSENWIPGKNVLNPCRESDAEIKEHITFVEEQIKPVNASTKGLQTIQKYRLDTELLDLQRSRQLQKLDDVIIKTFQQMLSEGRRDMTEKEKQAIRAFVGRTEPYSYMCEVFINQMIPGLL